MAQKILLNFAHILRLIEMLCGETHRKKSKAPTHTRTHSHTHCTKALKLFRRPLEMCLQNFYCVQCFFCFDACTKNWQRFSVWGLPCSIEEVLGNKGGAWVVTATGCTRWLVMVMSVWHDSSSSPIGCICLFLRGESRRVC